MASEQSTTQRATSPNGSGHSTSQHLASYASERAEILFGCYRRGDANDPDRYVAAIAAVLSTYDAELIREATDPRTGISTHERFRTFMPNSGELKAYCEDVASRRANIAKLAATPRPDFKRLPKPIDNSLGRRANCFVAPTSPQYTAMIARINDGADPADWKHDEAGRPGIWVPVTWLWDWKEGKRTTARARSLSDDDLRRHYARQADDERATV